ncbi:MAG: TIGR02186 family protein [Desulfobaccales bacterium]
MAARGNFGRRLAAVSSLLLILSLPALVRGASLDIKVSPAQVEIGAFFRGQTVTMTAIIPQGAEAVMEVVGQAGDEHLMRKGRRGGLWMNVGEINFHGAPSLYMAGGTNPKLLEAAGAAAPWGFPALKTHVTMSGQIQDRERDEFFAQFLKMKESEGIYTILSEPIKKSEASGGLVPVKGEFRLPTNVKPGSYAVCLSVIQEGQVTAKECGEIKVMMVGFPATIASLAYQHGAMYGILAVVIAIVVGFAMGFIFKGGGGH